MKKQKGFSILVIVTLLALLAAASAALSLQPMLFQLVRAKIPAIIDPFQAQMLLSRGLDQYERGEYPESEATLQFALLRGLVPQDQVMARKHLAFIHCAAERMPECRDEFRRALRADPSMDLDPAEAGHPTWGPVFSALRTER
jgi:hypothetical protein